MLRYPIPTEPVPCNGYFALQQVKCDDLRPKKGNSILKTQFAGIWSQTVQNCISPPPRKDCFVVKSEAHNGMFIGYGVGQNDQLYNDLWFLSFEDYKWKNINLTGDVVSPRTGARAVILGDNIIVFGGFAEDTYFADLHRIEITTGKVYSVQTTGEAPCKRCAPIISLYKHSLYIWGGFNVNEYPNDLHVLNLENFSWTTYPQNVKGAAGVPFCTIKNEVIIYCIRDNSIVLVINMDNNTVETRTTTGSPPACCLKAAMMTNYDKYIFFVGGRPQKTEKFMLIYCFDVEKSWWSVFHVMPDGETTSAADGFITEMRLFFVPRVAGGALTFNQNKKEIVYTLGCPMLDPPFINTISISEALGPMHLRDDMLNALKQ